MGTSIYLIADGSQIAPEAWERVYLESKRLLAGFPAPLMRLRVEERGRAKRYVYTPELVMEPDTPGERWAVCGDLTTRQSAEEFRLVRRHAAQFRSLASRNQISDKRDILWVENGEALDSFYGRGRLLWDSKTQGFPYHFATLAVGMLIETRFSSAAYVIGDIDRRDAEHAAAWVREVVGESLALPVCVDAKRLCKRLLDLYGNELPALRRFVTLFRGTLLEGWETIAKCVDSSLRIDFLTTCLEPWSSLDVGGASGHISAYLQATGDSEGLIESVRRATAAHEDGTAALSNEALLETISRAVGRRRQRWSETNSGHEKPRAKTDEVNQPNTTEKIKDSGSDTPPVGTRYIESAIARQTPNPPEEEELALAQRTDNGLRRGFLSWAPRSEITDREAILGSLYRATFEKSIVLTQAAWDAIDSLKDSNLLMYLFGLAAINNRSLVFCTWRRHLLETPRLWPTIRKEPA